MRIIEIGVSCITSLVSFLEKIVESFENLRSHLENKNKLTSTVNHLFGIIKNTYRKLLRIA